MKKAAAFFLLLWFFIIVSPGYAQQTEDDSEDEESEADVDWYGELPTLYSQGDKTFSISLGMTFPTLFIQDKALIESNISTLGGIGCLAFNFFLDSNFFLGAEIGGQFNSTLADNMLYIIPIGLRTGYQFIIWRIEIPLTLVAGIAPQTFLTHAYLGFFLKGGVSAYYRFNPDWSFGMDLSWSWFPQWTKEPNKNVDGNFFNLIFSARYHF